MRRVLTAVGGAVMVYAVVGAIADPDVRIVGVLTFLAVVLVGHDALVMPFAIGAGALLRRFVPAGDLGVVRAAALCSAAVVAVALPLVLGPGRREDNPSVLPLPYGRGLLIVLAAIWSMALAGLAVRRIRETTRKESERSAAPPSGESGR